MAKLGMFVAQFWEIFWDFDANYRSRASYGTIEDKEVKDLIASFAVWGWLPGETVVVKELTAEKKAAAIARMETHILDLENRAVREPEAAAELAVLKKIYFDEKGKMRVPKYEGTRCYRRAKFFPKGFAARLKIKPENRMYKPEEDFPLEVPCDLQVFENDTDLLISQLVENEQKLTGNMDVDLLSRLKAAKVLFEAGLKSKFRTIFKDGTGQKLQSILEVNVKVPEVNLWERMFMEPTNPNYVDAKKLHPTPMRELYYRNKKDVIPTADEVEETIEKLMEGGNAKKMASKKVIKSLATDNPNRLVQLVAQKILDDDTTSLPKIFNPIAHHLDYVERIVSAGKAVELLECLRAFEKQHFPKAEPIAAQQPVSV